MVRSIAVVQPGELSPSSFNFNTETRMWEVVFPEGTLTVSEEQGNALRIGTDGGAFLDAGLLLAYSLLLSTDGLNVELWSHPAGTTLEIAQAQGTANQVSSIARSQIIGEIDDVAIDEETGKVLNFTDNETGLSLSLNTALLLNFSNVIGDETVSVAKVLDNGVEKLKVSVNLADEADNLAIISEGGIKVPAEAVRQIAAGEAKDSTISATLANPGGDGNEVLTLAVDQSTASIGVIGLVNSSGDYLGHLMQLPDYPQVGERVLNEVTLSNSNALDQLLPEYIVNAPYAIKVQTVAPLANGDLTVSTGVGSKLALLLGESVYSEADSMYVTTISHIETDPEHDYEQGFNGIVTIDANGINDVTMVAYTIDDTTTPQYVSIGNNGISFIPRVAAVP